MDRKTYIILVLILGTLTALAPFSIDMYLPGFSAIAKDLDTSDAKVSLSLTGFFVGISAGQLLYGPLLDKFGRKKPLYIGLVVYILSSIGCSLAGNIEMLIGFRFIQALGSCAATVASVAMVRDLFPVKDSTKVFALLILILGVSPMVAPTVGGYITAAVGWHYIFGLLALIGALTLVASIFGLPNKFVPDATISLKPGPILGNFRAVLTEPQFYTYALSGAVAFAGLLAYVSGSPLLFMNVFGVNEKVYGWIFAGLSVGFIGCSQLNGLLLRRFSGAQIVRAALTIYAITGACFLAASLSGILTLPLILGFLFLMLGCIGVLNPNTAALSLAPFTKNAGSAAALMGAMQMGFGALVSVLISLVDKPSTLPLVAAMAGASILALIIFHICKRKIVHVYDSSDEAVLVH